MPVGAARVLEHAGGARATRVGRSVLNDVLRRVSRRWERSIRTRGLIGTVTHAIASVGHRLARGASAPRPGGESADDDFDRRHGVDTGGVIPQADLDVDGPNWVHGSAYVATSPVDFSTVLSPFELDIARTTFVDLGCGKGRVILMAAALPFARVVGVEYSPVLSGIARDNIARYRGPRAASVLEVVTGDAAEFQYPAGDLVVFMYHPFDAVVMQKVVAALGASMAGESRRLVVLYFKPVHAEPWRAASFVEQRVVGGLYDAYVGGSLRSGSRTL